MVRLIYRVIMGVFSNDLRDGSGMMLFEDFLCNTSVGMKFLHRSQVVKIQNSSDKLHEMGFLFSDYVTKFCRIVNNSLVWRKKMYFRNLQTPLETGNQLMEFFFFFGISKQFF